MKTFVIEYENSRMKEEFLEENKDSLHEFNIIWVKNPMVEYINIYVV
jgi:hypothetical protein